MQELLEVGEYQVTLFCNDNKYKPVSCIVKTRDKNTKGQVVSAGITKICMKRNWRNADRKRYGYTIAKIRAVMPRED